MNNQESKCSKCRRAGEKLFLKGDKCNSPKCPLLKRKYAPGQHGPTSRGAKMSGYGKQLKEKQEAKRIYGMRERQFANLVEEAERKVGDTSKILLSLLESRLDNVVYRMGLASSRALARQIVNHGHIEVNGKKVDIPSYRVKVGDEITVGTISKSKKLFAEAGEKLGKVEAPHWLMVDKKKLGAKILNTPDLETVPAFSVSDIIEFYSR